MYIYKHGFSAVMSWDEFKQRVWVNYSDGMPVCLCLTGLKLRYLLNTRSVYVNILSEGLPWYNCNGWLGIKHQVTYLLQVMVSSAVFDLIWDENEMVSASERILFSWSVFISAKQKENKQTTTTKMLMYCCLKWATNCVTNRLTWQKMSSFKKKKFFF